MASGAKRIYSQTLFIDSGAFSLYNQNVAPAKRIGKNGKPLARPPTRFDRSDVSYYTLEKGSEFRHYCDSYASFMREMKTRSASMLFANIDVILNPDKTWEIQQYFEKEHGLKPVPIVHCGTPIKYVDRYILYPLLGVGGFASASGHAGYLGWTDDLFKHICPKENDYLPVIRTHGFAMTSWKMITRYPWWSVDSTTWCRVSGFGTLYVPPWTQEKGFRFDAPPILINFSHRSPTVSDRHRHFDNVGRSVKANCLKWIEHVGVPLGSLDSNGKVKEYGVVTHHKARYIANLTYLKDLEESRPKWPHPLDNKIVNPYNLSVTTGILDQL